MRTHRAVAVLVLMLGASAAACSGDDDDSSRTVDPSEIRTLSAILDRQQQAVIAVTYRRGEDEFTIAQDGEKRAVSSGTSIFITDGDINIDCSVIDGTARCLEVPEGVSSIVNLGLIFYDVVVDGLVTAAAEDPSIATTDETIAGRSAVCLTGDSAEFLSELDTSLGVTRPVTAPVEARVCVDEETGYLLEYSTKSDPTNDLVAIEVTQPTSADFEPSAEVDFVED